MHRLINLLLRLGLANSDKIKAGGHTFGELFEHRHANYMALCRLVAQSRKSDTTVWRCKRHADGSMMKGWFLLGINRAPGTQITYPLPERLWPSCDFAEPVSLPPEWDKHTSNDVLDRLNRLQINERATV